MLDERSSESHQLPHSLEAEQAVLGGLMLTNDSFDTVASVISEDDFFGLDHQLIFKTMRRLSSEDKPLDVITLSETLQSANELTRVGGAHYLVELADNTPSSANISAYAQIVLERSIVRQLITAASDIARNGYTPLGKDSGDLLAEAERKLIDIMENRPKHGGFKDVNALLKEAVDRYEQSTANELDMAEAMMRDLGEQARRRAVG